MALTDPTYLVIYQGLVWKVTRIESEAIHRVQSMRRAGLMAYYEVA